MNGYGDIAANDEAEKQIYVFCLTYVPYTLQEDVKLDRNQLSSGDLVCGAIYTSPAVQK